MCCVPLRSFSSSFLICNAYVALPEFSWRFRPLASRARLRKRVDVSYISRFAFVDIKALSLFVLTLQPEKDAQRLLLYNREPGRWGVRGGLWYQSRPLHVRWLNRWVVFNAQIKIDTSSLLTSALFQKTAAASHTWSKREALCRSSRHQYWGRPPTTSKRFDLAHPHGDCVKLVLKPATAEMMRARPTMAVRARKRMWAFSGVGLMAGWQEKDGFHLMVEIEVIVFLVDGMRRRAPLALVNQIRKRKGLCKLKFGFVWWHFSSIWKDFPNKLAW